MIFSKIFDAMDECRRPIRWRNRISPESKIRVLTKILKILKFLSGNDIYFLFHDLFRYSKTFQRKYFASVSRESKALKLIIKKLNVRIKPKNKHHYLRALRRSGFSFEETKYLGYNASNHLWKACLDRRERKLGGRPQLSQNIKNAINLYLENNSDPSSYKIATQIEKNPLIMKKNEVKLIPKPQSKREIVKCRFLNNTISQLQ
jgi:hypothetical protein